MVNAEPRAIALTHDPDVPFVVHSGDKVWAKFREEGDAHEYYLEVGGILTDTTPAPFAPDDCSFIVYATAGGNHFFTRSGENWISAKTDQKFTESDLKMLIGIRPYWPLYDNKENHD